MLLCRSTLCGARPGSTAAHGGAAAGRQRQPRILLRTISLRCTACHTPHTRLLGLLCSLVLYAANQALALLCELTLWQAAHDHAHPTDGIACSAEHLGRVL